MAALACICEAQLQLYSSLSPEAIAEATDFLEKVAYVVESTLALANNVDEDDSLILECISLIGNAVGLAFQCNASVELKQRLQKLFWSIYRERHSSNVKLHVAWYRSLHVVTMHDTTGEVLASTINTLKQYRQNTYELFYEACLDSVVGCVVAMADHHPLRIVKVDFLYIFLFIS